ncbi:MAG: basic amino acid ABC transporter substrate-binding protein [Peptococcaceae bacterium]|nr:basic amino acid ABC transporter substrate-binding protein [Peptococcaceae bacterium]
MKRAIKLLLVMLTVAALAFVIVGCGGGEETASQDEEQQAGEGQQSKGKLVIGSDTAYAPFEWQDTETGEYIGFDMDLIDALCKEMGYEYEIKSMTFDGLIPALQAGTIDACITAMTIKPEREEKVNFTDPYYKSGLIVAVHKDNEEIKSFDDLKGKTIAVQIGTTGADMAATVKEEDPSTEIVTFDRIPEAFLALKQGNVDAVVNDAPVTLYAIKQDESGEIKVVGDMLSTEFYGIALPKNNPELLAEFNEALSTLKENGTFTEIYQEWFGEEPPEEIMQ